MTSMNRIATTLALPLVLTSLLSSIARSTGGVMTGSGTAADPYVVMDYADLKGIGTTYGLNMVYRLGGDIDASSSRTENGGAGFMPIGGSSSLFTGAIHGGGHVIRDLTIDRGSMSFVGFVARSTGTIDSLGLVNVFVRAGNYVGSLVGSNEGTTIQCYATGTVIALGGAAGGLVGTQDGYDTPGILTRCYANVSVAGGNGIGGLIGQLYYGNVTHCYALGPVNGTGNGVGGFAGTNYVGTFSNCYATGPVRGGISVGGLVGTNCFYHDRSMSSSYATGSVTGTGDNIGGLLGYNYGANMGTLSGCYSTGAVSGTGGKVGGLIGANLTTTVSGCYWDVQSSGRANGIGSNTGTAAVTGLTSAQTKISASFSGWDFASRWTIRPDSTCPGLRSLDNAPFAFADSFATGRTFSLARLLENDCDIETARGNLLLRVASLSHGTTDGSTTLTFPPSVPRGTIATLKYRIGEVRNSDTLWGNIATAILANTLMSGSGTEGDPYLVENYDDLKSVGITYAMHKVYRLAADIDASPSRAEHGDSGFVPIGTRLAPFTGRFHGGGRIVSHLTINRPTKDSIGLFGSVSGGTIDSLGLIGASITGRWDVGALVGYGTNDTIRACHTNGSVSGKGGFVGGLIGRSGPGRITDSYSTCAVALTGNTAGGLIGNNNGARVSDSYATGSVTALSVVGGLVGSNIGTITSSYATGPVNGTNNSEGGFVGSNTGTISGCYAIGSASGSTYVGGFAGVNGVSASIAGCFWDRTRAGLLPGVGLDNNAATVTGLTTAQMKNAGNFAGWNFDTTWTIRRDSTYPGLRKVDNAPFAFIDSIALPAPGEFAVFLLNDCDIETGESRLTLLLTSIDADTDRVSYRVGELRAADTLWGNMANACVVLPGRGTAGDPYLVGSYRDLKKVGTICDLGSSYRLVADIDASASATEHGDSGFVPIGRFAGAFSTNFPFTGTFHGGGHVIRNLTINRPAMEGVGLFGMTEGSTIDSLGLRDGSVTGAGGVGSLVGRHTSGSRVSGCFGALPVRGTTFVGGLIGHSSASMVEKSYATDAVACSTTFAGGLVGHMSANSEVSESYATGSVTGSSGVGGLVGYNDGSLVRDSYATGPIASTGSSGGLMGQQAGSGATIRRSYATGSVAGTIAGGLLGANGGGIEASYWNPATSGLATGVGSGSILGVDPLNTSQMRDAVSFVGWHFDTTWIIRTDSTYPGLRHLENAPFAFDDTIRTGKTFPVSRLLTNDCDLEGAQGGLSQRLLHVETGTIDDGGIFSFPESAPLGTVARIKYRLGETGLADTLWGNIATALIFRTLPGSGTPADPYLVERYCELRLVGADHGFDRVYRLVADIDASPSASEHGDSGFVPIGTPLEPFTGTFHGGGHIIRHLTINRPTADYLGFIGSLHGGSVDSLGLLNLQVRGGNVVGGLVGNDSGTVVACHTTGTVWGKTYVGGLTGISLPGGVISRSYSTCVVSASAGVAGGLVGTNTGGMVDECYSTGPVSAPNNVGGLIGTNTGTISRSYATGRAQSSVGNLGGLIGSSFSGVITDCYAAGRVTGGTIAGGLLGYNGNDSWVGRSYWDTLASGRPFGVGTNLGGAFITGAPSADLKKIGTFDTWDFDSTWTIRADSTYPGLTRLVNAPFAFADSIKTVSRNVNLGRLLLNDADVESGRARLTLRVESLSAGTTDSVSTLSFADTAANLTVSFLTYRVGEVNGVDTLWGNHAVALITFDTVVVTVKEQVGLPLAFTLKQNYPNPFNPSTTIAYALPRPSRVSLKVYNMLGEEVAILVDQEQGAGEYQARLDGRMLASGVYFYALRAGDFLQTRRLLLLK